MQLGFSPPLSSSRNTMPSNQRRELTWHQRFILLLGLAVLLISLIGVLSLVPATSAIRQQGQMLRLRFKLQSIDASSEALPRMPIEELIRFLPQLPRIDQSAIPKLIHQSYKNTTLPADFQTYRKSWSLYHPTWLYQFWTDEDNRQLVSTHFPWFLDTYDNLPQKIMRPDAARYMYMYLFGGVYADLDMEALQPLDPLLAHRHAALAWMGPADDHPHNLPNAWMASEPGHPFWLMMLMHIMHCPKDQAAEHLTGPGAVKTTYFKYWLPTNQTGMDIIEPGLVYPHDWARSEGDIRKYCRDTFNQNPTFDPAKCKEVVKGAYAVTYWRHGWEYARR